MRRLFQQRGSARDTAFTAETGRLAALAPTLAETDLSLSMLLGVEAVRRADTPEALGALQHTFVAADTSLGFLFSDEPLRAVFVDGDRIIGFGESTVIRWDAASHERIDVIPLGTPVRDRGPLSTHPVSYVHGVVAWVGNDDVARVLDLATPDLISSVGEGATSVAIDPTATRIAIAMHDGGLTVVDRASLRRVWELPGDGITAVGQSGLTFDRAGILPSLASFDVDTWPSQVTFTPDSATVLHSRAGWINWLDAATGVRRGRVQSIYQPAPDTSPDRVTNAFKAFAFDQGGGRVFVSALGAFRAFDATSMSVSAQFERAQQGASGFNTALQPLPDGTVAILRAGGELSVVDPDARLEVSAPIDTRVGRGSGLALGPDGTTMLVAGDRGVSLIATDGSGLIRQSTAFPADRPVLSATRDAAWVSASGYNGNSAEYHTPLKFWHCTPDGPCTPGEPLPWVDNTTVFADPWSDTWVRFHLRQPPTGQEILDAPTGAPLSPVLDQASGFGGTAAIPADRSWVMIDTTDQAEEGKLQVHALPSGDRIATLDVIPGVLSVAISPSEDVTLWFNPTDGRSFLVDSGKWAQRPSPLGAGEVAAAAYSQDGRWLVTADTAGDLVVRDPMTFKEIRRMSSEGASSRGGFVFSDDGRYLVSNQDGSGRLWDVESGQLIGRPIEGAPAVTSASFPGQPAGFVTANDGFIQIWRFDPPTWLDIACKAAGRNLTRAEWDLYGPRDRDYRATCPEWPAAA